MSDENVQPGRLENLPGFVADENTPSSEERYAAGMVGDDGPLKDDPEKANPLIPTAPGETGLLGPVEVEETNQTESDALAPPQDVQGQDELPEAPQADQSPSE